jgi:two-component system KDP operon response regulator KdpE
LVCDHESQTLRALRVVLQGSGFWMDPVRTAAGALSHSALRAPDAAIIALELPDGDGVEVCRCLREWSAMPVILLSSVNDEQELVRALEAGADDFVTKPFRPRELVARLNAKLRRAVPAAAEPRVELHGLEIDLARRSVRRDGEDIHLTPIEFKLLAVLLRNRGRLLTHRALLAAVWGAAYVSDRRTLRAHIANLRRKIEPAEGVRLIRTDHRVGYRLAAESSGSDGPSWPIEEAVDPSLTRDLLVRVEAPAPADGVSASRRLRDAYGRVA